MSVCYTFKGPKRKAHRGRAACYSYIHQALRTVAAKGEKFTLTVDLDAGTSFRRNVKSRAERSSYMKAWKALFVPWLDPSWYRVTYKGTIFQGVEYTHECPIWVFIASASVFRMWSDMSMFITFWDRLETFDLKPWTRYAIVVSLSNHSNSDKDFTKDRVTVDNNTNHMPISSHRLNEALIRKFNNLTYEDDLIKGLPSMKQEFIDTDSLNHRGRDSHFCNTEGGGNWVKEAATRYNILKCEKKEIDGGYNYQPTINTIRLSEFIKKVIIPNKL